MDEQTMPEQQLSEELLQQITGGCQECNRDKIAIQGHQISIGLNLSNAKLAEYNGNYDKYDFHMNSALSHYEKSVEAGKRIDQREATPGHVELPEPQRPPGRRWIM